MIVRRLDNGEYYGSRDLCEARAGDKLRAAILLFNQLEDADSMKVENGEL